MKTVILCGGMGTRIRDVAKDIPKPMVELNGMPILFHIMRYYSYFNHKDFLLLLGYRGEVIKDFFLNFQTRIHDFTINLKGKPAIDIHKNGDADLDWSVTLAETGLESLTGTRLLNAKQYLVDEEHFMLTYGDGVGDIDIDALVKFHKSHNKMMTITGTRPPARFGELKINADGLAEEFAEKPQATEGLISGGFFVCRRELLDYLEDFGDNFMLERAPMQKLAKMGEMMVYQHEGFWQPMDTYRDYTMLVDMIKQGTAPWVKS